jgi:methylmalonyl-CoA mutase N-terminal domain/subunit
VARLEALRRERDNTAVSAALDALKQVCAGEENVMPYLISAAKAYATLGEMVDVMREVFGVYHEPVQV